VVVRVVVGVAVAPVVVAAATAIVITLMLKVSKWGGHMLAIQL